MRWLSPADKLGGGKILINDRPVVPMQAENPDDSFFIEQIAMIRGYCIGGRRLCSLTQQLAGGENAARLNILQRQRPCNWKTSPSATSALAVEAMKIGAIGLTEIASNHSDH
jgi:hypothetical protein